MADRSTSRGRGRVKQAYQESLKILQEEKEEDRKAEKRREEEAEVVKRSEGLSADAIVKQLAELKLQMGTALEEIEAKLVGEVRKLTELRRAIEIETRRLEEIHEITVNADSLAALVKAQEQEKETAQREMLEEREQFEKEMEEKRAAWKKETEESEVAVKERKARVEKERKQEEEDFVYNLQKKRKLDEDAYQAKKAALEKELVERRSSFEKEMAEREKAVAELEAEYAELKKKAEAFPAELEKAVAEAEKRTKLAIETSYAHAADLLKKEIEGERKLNQLQVASLEAKIKEKDALIAQLTQKVNDAGRQVQEIAVKAIEGAAKPTIVREVERVAGEGGKAEYRGRG